MTRSTEDATRPPAGGPAGHPLAGLAWVGYFLALLAAPLVAPVVLNAAVGVDPLAALKLALKAAAVGYAVGLVVLIRP